MKTFKEYVNGRSAGSPNRPILGVTEIINIEGIGEVEAKIDSGNEAYNVLLGLDIEHHGHECTFTTVNDKRCLLYTSPSPRDRQKSRMPSSA